MKFLNLLIIFSFISSQVLGSPEPSPSPPTQFEVTPSTLRVQLLEGNLSIVQAINGLRDAKDQVAVQRGNLLPSLNLGGMISSAKTFFLSSVQFLLPFLLPSNWFNYKAQKETFESDKLSFYIFELNTLSSALSLYYTILADEQTAEVYSINAKALRQIEKVQRPKYELGLIPPQDYKQVKTQADLGDYQASALRQLVAQEVASLRHSLGLTLATKPVLTKVNQGENPWEERGLQEVADLANKVSPERFQISKILEAAKSERWSAVFGWINGATLGSTSNGPGSAGFSNLNGGASLSLGFARFPTVRIAKRYVKEVELQDLGIVQGNTEIIERTMLTFKEAKTQMALASEAETLSKSVYSQTFNNFALGTSTFVDLLVALTQVTNSSVDRIRAEENLNLQRVVLNRMSISDEFSKVRACGLKDNSKTPKNASLDQLCRL